MKFKKIVIIGIGLIGGSIGKALLKNRLAREVVGVARKKSSLDKAMALKAITAGYVNDYKRALRGADIVIIATPISEIENVIRSIVNEAGKGSIITDVASTKQSAVNLGEKLCGKCYFVGSHPLAGSEKRGPEYSQADLFRNSLCILTKTPLTNKNALLKVSNLWKALGARVKIISPSDHDMILAYTSHLPHLLSFSMVKTLKRGHKPFVAGGFKDLTRIASSDSVIWSDIFFDNRKYLLKALKDFRRSLDMAETLIKSKSSSRLQKYLDRIKTIRDGIQ